ncbi:hypothetical protein MRX96_030625 [Rhipicephalus microplus]
MSVKCSIFLSSFLHCQRDIRSEEEAQEALFYTANLAVCCGVGRMQEFHQVDLSNVTKSTGGSLYANACNGSVSLELSTHSFQQCSACKTVRRIALMRRLRLKNKARRPVLNTLKKRLQHAVRTLRRRSKKVQVLCSNLERLKEKNSAIEASVLEKKICELPKKQQNAVRTCFQAAKRRCLSFYSLAKSPRGGSLSPGLLDSLLSAEEALVENEKHDDVVTMDAVEVAVDHADYVEKRSDPRLVYYIAGYVARKRILSTNCTACRDACLVPKDSVSGEVPADASKEWDLGGLLYPAVSLYHLIECLESRLTREFSRTNLHSKAALSILGKVSTNVPQIGCVDHCQELTRSVVRFFSLTRIHFLLRGLNQETNDKKVKRIKPCVM